MLNVIKGEVLYINSEFKISKVYFSHYSDKNCKRFWALNGVEYDCKDVLV